MAIVNSWFSSIVLQMGDFAMEGAVWTYMGSNMDSLMESETTIPSKASTYMLTIQGIFSITHSSN